MTTTPTRPRRLDPKAEHAITDAPATVRLTDLTITCLVTDGHHYGQKEPHQISGEHVARLLVLAEAWMPGGNTLFDEEMAMATLQSILAVGRVATLGDHVELDNSELYDFFNVLEFLSARVAATEAFVSLADLGARYVVAPTSADTKGTR